MRVVYNPAEHRYELWDDDRLAGRIDYREVQGGLALVHTEVEPRGQGLGTILVRDALEDMRERGLEVVPVCPFVVDYVRRSQTE